MSTPPILRPSGPILAIGIINLVWACVAMVGGVFILFMMPSAFSLHYPPSGDAQLDQGLAELNTTMTIVRAFITPIAIGGFLLGSLLFVATVQLLRLRPWGRVASLCTAWLMIGLAVISLISSAFLHRWPSSDLGGATYCILQIAVLMSRDTRALFSRAAALRAANASSATHQPTAPPLPAT